MPFLTPSQQRQSTEGMKDYKNRIIKQRCHSSKNAGTMIPGHWPSTRLFQLIAPSIALHLAASWWQHRCATPVLQLSAWRPWRRHLRRLRVTRRFADRPRRRRLPSWRPWCHTLKQFVRHTQRSKLKPHLGKHYTRDRKMGIRDLDTHTHTAV